MPPIKYKHDLILERVKGKKVLHIGATDYPFHSEKGRAGTLLHQKIRVLCSDIVGMDFDRGAIAELRKFGIDDILFGDIIRGEYEEGIKGREYDIILFTDVIEHLDNPGIALDNIRSLCSPNTTVIVTAPNAWSIVYLINHFRETEAGHPDHRFWPTKATMDVLFRSCGFETAAFQYCLASSRPAKRTVRGRLFKWFVHDNFHHTGQTLFYELKPSGAVGQTKAATGDRKA